MEQGEYDLVSVSALSLCGHLGVSRGKWGLDCLFPSTFGA
jgi:hypothetical protein